MPMPLVVPDPTDTFGVGQIALAATQLVAAGFIFDYSVMPVDFSLNGVSYFANMLDDVQNDPGHGTGLVGTFAEWLDHKVLDYMVQFALSTPPPIILAGFSLGGWAALRLSTAASPFGLDWNIKGCFAHCPATMWELIISLSPSPVGTDFSGLDLGPGFVDTTTVPTAISYSDNDGSAGFALSSQPGYQAPGPQSNAYSMAHLSGNANVSATIAASSSTGVAPIGYPNGHVFIAGGAGTDSAHVVSFCQGLGLSPTF
jgi:hypothetical protein